MRHLLVATMACALLVAPTIGHTIDKGPATESEDVFTPDQVRNFTRNAQLPGGTQASVSVLAMHQHKSEVDNVLDVVFSDLSSVASALYEQNPNSDISRINARASRGPVQVSAATIELLQIAKKVNRQTRGAFDIVTEGTGKIGDIKISSSKKTVSFSDPSIRIDASSLVDGYLADRLMGTIWNSNIDNAMVTVGEVSRSVGNDVVGQWRKTVTDVAGRFAGQGMAISFSNAATATIAAGSKVPGAGSRMGEALIGSDIRSTTIIAKDAVTAQGVAKAVNNLGADEGMALVNSMNNVKAVVRDNSGRLRRSPGL